MLGADPGIAKREGHNIRVSYAVPLYRGMPPPPRILVAFSCSEIASSAIRGVRGWGGGSTLYLDLPQYSVSTPHV